ncbi:MAG: glutaredoxin family protein [Deltaproteobacteria bacterium]|nr:glutaredoxin family protein [Deltaproteobacteria bacterium]
MKFNKNSHTFILIFITISIVSQLLFSCTSKSDNTTNDSKSHANSPKPPLISDNSKNILFSWFEDNQPKTATEITKIPETARKEVRVQDLSVPPEKRDPSFIFIADLTKKNPDKSYFVKVYDRKKYEQKRHPRTKEKPSEDKENNIKIDLPVILYATKHCPHCKRARKWLLENNIPFKELDIEADQNAVARLEKLGLEQGVSTGGVPMFEINNRLIPGFDPAAVIKALKMPPLKSSPPKIVPKKQPAAPVIPPISPSGATVI